MKKENTVMDPVKFFELINSSLELLNYQRYFLKQVTEGLGVPKKYLYWKGGRTSHYQQTEIAHKKLQVAAENFIRQITDNKNTEG